jgi:hypothetical protein
MRAAIAGLCGRLVRFLVIDAIRAARLIPENRKRRSGCRASSSLCEAECAAMPPAKSHIVEPPPQRRRRSRDYNAEALSNAKKAIRQFSGELADPIRVERPKAGLIAADILNARLS